jgi:hypothetical protein
MKGIFLLDTVLPKFKDVSGSGGDVASDPCGIRKANIMLNALWIYEVLMTGWVQE